jgi:hypothetical protein
MTTDTCDLLLFVCAGVSASLRRSAEAADAHGFEWLDARFYGSPGAAAVSRHYVSAQVASILLP